MGTEEPALTRRFRLIGQISMSGASQRYVHILVSHIHFVLDKLNGSDL